MLLCQRQEHRRRGDTFVLDDDGAIVKRRRRIEYRYKQVVADPRVELNTRIDEISQTDLSLDYDQCSGLLRR